MKLKHSNIKAILIRVFFSLVVAVYIVAVISDFYPDTETAIKILIGSLVFLLIDTAAKFIPIEEIINKVL